MSIGKELENLQNVRRVSKVQFGLLDPDEIRRGSVCEILNAETYDGTEPVSNGLFDTRMGVIERGPRCATCENDSTLCPGHFGHINLALPVFYVHFMPYVVKLLYCVCFRCSNLLIKKNNAKLLSDIQNKTTRKRFKTIYDFATKSQKTSRCCYNEGCRVVQPFKYTLVTTEKAKGQEKENIVSIVVEFKDDAIRDPTVSKRQYFTPEHCYEIFRKITSDDVTFLGFSPKYSRPEWMICMVLPVPPPAVRPSVQRESNQRSEDDLTYVLNMIVKANNKLKEHIEREDEEKKISAAYNFLQYNVATLITNKGQGIPKNTQRSGKVIKSLVQRLSQKEGRIRGNLMGKRVDFSARTVVSVGPDISIEEVGIPKKIAMVLTFPEVVTPYNMAELTRLVRNGPNLHPGAKRVQRMEYDCFGNPAPCTISLKNVDVNSIVLKVGDVVHRHIQDGDTGLFNRQPSLHRMSMMAHKVRIVEQNTFRLNTFVTPPYNADFDGDEMNIHIPQSYQTRIELKELAPVAKQIISPARSAPIIQVVQDSLVGSYILSKQAVAATSDNIDRLLLNTVQLRSDFNLVDARKKKQWTGLELFSAILPNVNLQKNGVVIRNGDVVSGTLTKKILGGESGGLIQAVFEQFGPRVCRDFLDNIQRLITAWLEEFGFSIGFGDAMPSRKAKEGILAEQDEMRKKIEQVITTAQQGLYKPDLSENHRMIALDIDIKNIMNNTTTKIEEIVTKDLPENNNFMTCVNSGSKGKPVNINQIMGTVGQQEVEGSRIPFGFTRRTLPHFTKEDHGAISRGYCANSFMGGLDPHEFFFMSMGARTGTINTSIKTADTGYRQRQMIKAVEDLYVRYDDSIRDAYDNIVQFYYGDDNFDPVHLEKVSVSMMEYNDATMTKEYQWKVEEILPIMVTPAVLTSIQTDEKKVAMVAMALEGEWQQLMSDRKLLREKIFRNLKKMDASIHSPINFFRLVREFKFKFNVQPNDVTDLDPLYVLQEIKKLCETIVKYIYEKRALEVLKILIRSTLSTKQCIQVHRFSRSVFDLMIKKIENKVLQAFVQPGEMVGIIAAQSMGEPLTQMSVRANEKIQVAYLDHGKLKICEGEIGEFVDSLMREDANTITDEHESSFLDVSKKMFVAGVSKDEKVSWNSISQVTRHRPRGDLVKVITRSYRTVTCTLSHSFLTRSEKGVVPIKGSDLKVGDYVPVIKKLSAPGLGQEEDDLEVSLFQGHLASRFVPSWVFGMPNEYVRNVLRRLFDSMNHQEMIVFSYVYYDSKSPHLVEQVALLLSRFGIVPLIFRDLEDDKATRLDIYGEDVTKFIQEIGFIRHQQYLESLEPCSIVNWDVIPALQDVLQKMGSSLTMPTRSELQKELEVLKKKFDVSLLEQACNSDVMWDEIISLEVIEAPDEFVYDFTVPGNETFALLSGILVHNTLSQFHYAGVGGKAVVTNSGISRFEEIIRLSENIKTPSMLIYLKPEYAQTRDLALKVKNEIEFTKLKDILLQSQILYLPDAKAGKYEEEKEAYNLYQELSGMMELECQNQENLSNWVLWMEFDQNIMINKGIYMQDVQEVIMTNCNVDMDIQCVFSDMNSGHLTLRVRVRQDFEEGTDYVNFFKEMGDCLLNITLRGINGINKVGMTQEHRIIYDPDGTHRNVPEWVLNTDGSNLIEVLSNEYVDEERTTTNNIMEVYKVFGLDAARNAIIQELVNTFREGDAKDVAMRHMTILADIMSYRGLLMQISRDGFGQSPYMGPLGRASFEVMDKVLVAAGVFAEKDNMRGTSSNIIAGQAVLSGTNSFNLYINDALLPRHSVALQIAPVLLSRQELPALEDESAFEFEDLEQKPRGLVNYLREITAQPVDVTENDFLFGYDMMNEEENRLTEAQVDTIDVNIIKSQDGQTKQRRRRTKK